jgi:SAM-dependent methyltransferase
MKISHANWPKYLYSEFGKNKTVIEIGSRNVTGFDHRAGFAGSDYTGLDIHPGKNVDVVGDAHRLSSYFPENKFDLVFSAATFEHLAMPWVVATEINKVLKPGGVVFIETHFAYGLHSLPCHFFHFTDIAIKTLFAAVGFECIEAGMCNPVDGKFAASADEYLRGKKIEGMFCHAEYLGRKVAGIGSIEWIANPVEKTTYPL